MPYTGHDLAAIVLGQRGDLREAIARLRRGLELDSRDVSLPLNLGNALRLQGDREGTTESYRRAVELEPTNTSARAALAELE